LTKKIIAVIAL